MDSGDPDRMGIAASGWDLSSESRRGILRGEQGRTPALQRDRARPIHGVDATEVGSSVTISRDSSGTGGRYHDSS